jgi:hypothetical protein
VLVIKDEEVNVNRCAVPYGLDARTPVAKFCIPNTLITDHGADLVIGRASELNIGVRQVRLGTGEVFPYDRLVLAMGARPLIPPIPGVGSKRVLPVRTLADMGQLRERAAIPGRSAVVVGGGYIGVEEATELRRLGLDVTLVEMLPHILLHTAEREFIAPLEETLTRHGVTLRTGRGRRLRSLSMGRQSGSGSGSRAVRRSKRTLSSSPSGCLPTSNWRLRPEFGRARSGSASIHFLGPARRTSSPLVTARRSAPSLPRSRCAGSLGPTLCSCRRSWPRISWAGGESFQV